MTKEGINIPRIYEKIYTWGRVLEVGDALVDLKGGT